MDAAEREELARRNFTAGYNCAQSVVRAFDDVFEEHGVDPETAALLASPLGGGMGRMREVCGAVSGMLLVLGLAEGYNDPEAFDAKKELYEKAQALAGAFKDENGSIICRELLGLDAGPSEATPEKRTESYYGSRPCAELVASRGKPGRPPYPLPHRMRSAVHVREMRSTLISLIVCTAGGKIERIEYFGYLLEFDPIHIAGSEMTVAVLELPCGSIADRKHGLGLHVLADMLLDEGEVGFVERPHELPVLASRMVDAGDRTILENGEPGFAPIPIHPKSLVQMPCSEKNRSISHNVVLSHQVATVEKLRSAPPSPS